MYLFVILGIVLAIFVFVGLPYILGSRKQKTNYNIDSKRSYVIANLDKFKVNNEGTSLDEKEVYLVDLNRIGL